MNKLCVLDDAKKAFIQVRVHYTDRDAQQVIWYKDLKKMEMMDLRFIRELFGSSSSHYNLYNTMKQYATKKTKILTEVS